MTKKKKTTEKSKEKGNKRTIESSIEQSNNPTDFFLLISFTMMKDEKSVQLFRMRSLKMEAEKNC